MKVLKVIIIILVATLCSLYAKGPRSNKDDYKIIKKEFKDITSIDIELVSGDCDIISAPGKVILVEVKYNVKPVENYTPEFHKKGQSLRLGEDWKGNTNYANIRWTITAPSETEIEFSAASGDLTIENMNADIESSTASGDISIRKCNGEIEIETASGDITADMISGEMEFSAASGDIEIDDCKGEIDISTASGDVNASNLDGLMDISAASGDIEMEDCKGEFDVSVASGDVEAINVIIEEPSDFSAASGDVEVVLGSPLKVDLEVTVASGDATLDFNGNKITGTIEMKARKRNGKINAPFKADKTEEVEEYNSTYVVKTFNKGNGPLIEISTHSGEANLLK